TLADHLRAGPRSPSKTIRALPAARWATTPEFHPRMKVRSPFRTPRSWSDDPCCPRRSGTRGAAFFDTVPKPIDAFPADAIRFGCSSPEVSLSARVRALSVAGQLALVDAGGVTLASLFHGVVTAPVKGFSLEVGDRGFQPG